MERTNTAYIARTQVVAAIGLLKRTTGAKWGMPILNRLQSLEARTQMRNTHPTT
jgi:hypothetical protein